MKISLFSSLNSNGNLFSANVGGVEMQLRCDEKGDWYTLVTKEHKISEVFSVRERKLAKNPFMYSASCLESLFTNSLDHSTFMYRLSLLARKIEDLYLEKVKDSCMTLKLANEIRLLGVLATTFQVLVERVAIEFYVTVAGKNYYLPRTDFEFSMIPRDAFLEYDKHEQVFRATW